MKTITLTDCRARLDDARSAKTATDAIMKVTIDVTREDHHAEVNALVPGFLGTIYAMAAEESPAREIKLSGKKPALAITLHAGDAEKTPVISCATAVMRAIKIVVSRNATAAYLVITFAGTLSKPEWAALRENIGADIMASLTLTEAPEKVKKGKKGKKGALKVTVVIDDSNQMDLLPQDTSFDAAVDALDTDPVIQ